LTAEVVNLLVLKVKVSVQPLASWRIFAD